jgi:hypothetical protein
VLRQSSLAVALACWPEKRAALGDFSPSLQERSVARSCSAAQAAVTLVTLGPALARKRFRRRLGYLTPRNIAHYRAQLSRILIGGPNFLSLERIFMTISTGID